MNGAPPRHAAATLMSRHVTYAIQEEFRRGLIKVALIEGNTRDPFTFTLNIHLGKTQDKEEMGGRPGFRIGSKPNTAHVCIS